MKNIALIFCAFLFFSPLVAQETPLKKEEIKTSQIKENSEKDIQTIAFGSCNRQDKPQIMWYFISQNNPDLWVWLGDNIYGDTEDMKVMKNKYYKVKECNGYKELCKKCPVIGTWDDHDYGKNDGDKTYKMKEESKTALLNFLEVPTDAKVRKRPGIYDSYTYGTKGKKVKVILLDTRWFRDVLIPDNETDNRYLPNLKGTVLGDHQWEWLEKELMNSDAQLHLICSGTQIIPEEHPYEKWGNFPKERIKLLRTLQKTQVKNVLFLTGDRHLAEISKMEIPGLTYPVYEITASGLTHTAERITSEPNQYREGELINKRNFGMLRINWSSPDLIQVLVEIRGLGNELFLQQQLEYSR